MKLLAILSVALLFFASPVWLTDLDQARQIAKEKNKLILVNFSGSDWCGPCIKLKKTIFSADAFSQYAEQNLVLVNVDFPRMKKNHLSAEQTAINNKLAEAMNSKGIFPLTLLLDAEGKVLKKWEGSPAEDADSFINQLKSASK